MGKKVSYSYKLEADPGAEGFVTIHTVEAGCILHLKKVEIAFPTGTEDELEISFYYGNMKVLPKQGVFTGDAVKYEKQVDLRYFSGDPVKVYYKNLNATLSRVCDIVIEGTLE